jgi:hypothetical protein
MPDETLKKLTEAISTLTDVVSQIAQTAKPEHLNFLDKDLIQQRLSGVNASLEEVKIGKLDDPTLS